MGKRRTHFHFPDLEQWFILFLIVEISLWIYMNLSQQIISDNDQGKMLYHMVCMWREKRLLIPDWKYVSTLELDCSNLLALPLYGLTNNVLLSFSIANIVFILLLVFVIVRLMHNCSLSIGYSCLAAAIVLLPFGHGFLEYDNMLFLHGNQYIIKAMLPLWMLEIMTLPDSEKKKTNNLLQIFFFLLILFVSVFSSGLYVFLCGIIPILACDIFYRLHSSSWKDFISHSYFNIAVCFVTAISFLFHKISGLSALTESMALVSLSDFIPNLGVNITSLFQLFGILHKEETLAVSLTSGLYIAKFIFLLALLACAFHAEKEMLSHVPAEKAVYKIHQNCLAGTCATVFFWNAFILQLTDCKARYHLIGALPLILCFVIIFSQAQKKKSLFRIFRTENFIFLFILIISAWSWKSVYASSGNYYNDYFSALQKLADSYDVHSIVIISDSGMTECARPLDVDRVYVTYFPKINSIKNYDYYRIKDDRSGLDDRHLLVDSIMNEYALFSPHLRDQYELVGEVFGDPVYLAENCILDGIAGPFRGYETIDFPNTFGYKYEESYDQSGKFLPGQSRTVLKSPSYRSENATTTTLFYKAVSSKSVCGQIELQEEGTRRYIDLPSDQTSVSFVIPSNTEFTLSVHIEADTELIIESIHYDSR